MKETLISIIILLSLIITSCSQSHTDETYSLPQVSITTSYPIFSTNITPSPVSTATLIAAYPLPYPAPNQVIESLIATIYPPPKSQYEYTPPPPPTCTATPTPTLVRPTPTLPPSLSSLRIVYTNNGDLWLWTMEKTILLTAIDESTFKVHISDDGKVIAFNREGGLWAINSDGTGERLLVSAEDFKKMQPTNPGVALAQLGWVPNTHILLFNTTILTGYGITNTDDLHWVNAETGYTVQLLQPQRGGNFYPSPDGKMVAIVTPREIRLMNINGSNYHKVLEYPSVAIPSEYWYYAHPIWVSDSQSLMVAIPPEELYYATTEPTTIWKLPIDGSPAILVSQLPAGYNEYISPDLLKIITMRFIKQDITNMFYEMHITSIDGSEDMIYLSGPFIFQTWALDSKHFVLWQQETNNYWLGQADTDLMVLTESSFNVGSFAWIDFSHFIYMGGQNGLDELRIGTVGEPSIFIVSQNNGNVPIHFDWTK